MAVHRLHGWTDGPQPLRALLLRLTATQFGTGYRAALGWIAILTVAMLAVGSADILGGRVGLTLGAPGYEAVGAYDHRF